MLALALSPGQAGDAPWGRALLERLGPQSAQPTLLADRADEGDQTRALAHRLGFQTVIPPHPNRRQPWTYDRQRYRGRNVVERLFRRLRRFRRIHTRYDKLDIVFLSFIYLALIYDALNHPLA